MSLFFSPRRPTGLLLPRLLLIRRLREKWGGSPRDALVGAFARPGGHGPRVRGVRRRGWDVERRGRCPRRRASLVRAGAEAQEPRRDGGGGGRYPSSLFHTYLPFRWQLALYSHRLRGENACALGAFVRGSPAGNRGVDPYKDQLPARGQCQGSSRCECRCIPV